MDNDSKLLSEAYKGIAEGIAPELTHFPLTNLTVTPMWIVTYPTEDSTLQDICFSVDIEGLANQFKGGLHADDIYAAYVGARAPSEAERVARQMLIHYHQHAGEISAPDGLDLKQDYDRAVNPTHNTDPDNHWSPKPE